MEIQEVKAEAHFAGQQRSLGYGRGVVSDSSVDVDLRHDRFYSAFGGDLM